MAYDLPTWVNGGPPTRNATNLNKYSAAIDDLDDRVEGLETNNAQAQDLANATDPTKGAALIGYEGRTVRVELGDTYVNVKRGTGGAKGDDSTDDTTAIQNKLNALTQGQTLYFPNGTYRTSSVLNFPASTLGVTLLGGQGLNGAIIKQMTNNTQVMKFTGHDISQFTIQGLNFTYGTAQTSSHTSSAHILFTATTSSMNGAYLNAFRDCKFRNGYRGIAIDEAVTGGTYPVWALEVHRCNFEQNVGNDISLVYPGAAGAPRVTVGECWFNADATTKVERMIRISQVTQLKLEGLDIEGSNTAPIQLIQCYGSLRDIHLERHNLSGANPDLVYFNGGLYDVESWDIANVDFAATVYSRIMRADNTARINWGGFNIMDITRPGGNTQPVFILDGTSATYRQRGEYRNASSSIVSLLDTSWQGDAQFAANRPLPDAVHSMGTQVAGSRLRPTQSIIEINQTTTVTMTAVPNLYDGYNGQTIQITNVGTNDLTLQDQSVLAGSNLRLEGGTNKTLTPWDTITLRFSTARADWMQVAPMVATA